MRYKFQCKCCESVQEYCLDMCDYDVKVNQHGLLVGIKCLNCSIINNLYRYIDKAPVALGGTNGYISVERWMSKNKGIERKNKEEVEKLIHSRKRFVKDRINKHSIDGDPGDRHKDYGPNSKEDKLSL